MFKSDSLGAFSKLYYEFTTPKRLNFLYIRRTLYINVIKVCPTDTYINMYLPVKEEFSCHNV